MTPPKAGTLRRFLERAREAGLEDLPLIELRHGEKNPAATSGLKLEDGTLNPRWKLTPDEATAKMEAGANIGAYGSPGGLLFIDVDLTGGKLPIPPATVEAMIEALDTFTVRTRSGGYHLYFQNVGPVGDGTTRNPHIWWHGQDAGECRADWQYVLMPGSFVDPDHDPTGKGKKGKTADATGYYSIRHDAPIRPFDAGALPDGLTLARGEARTRPTAAGSNHGRAFRNLDGLDLAIVRQRAPDVDQALGGAVEADRSAADQGLVNRLVWWNFDDVTIAEILRSFRPTEKTERPDYLATTIASARTAIGDDRYDPARLMPKEKAAEIAKAPPADLATAIARGGLVFVGKAKKEDDLRDLALYLVHDGRDTPEVVKGIGRKNGNLPEADRLSDERMIALGMKAADDLATARRRALAAAVVLRREKAAAPPTPEEIAAADAARKIEEEAREILEHGDPFAYVVAAYNLDHIGDQVLGQCLALSFASRMVKNSKGLHVLTTGESGKGKSDGFDTFLKQVPKGSKLDGSFTDKTLYYMGEKGTLAPGTVLIIDDKDLSDTLQAILKEATSDFRKSISLHTMTIQREAKTVTIPERCLLWLCKVEGAGDDQVLNRMLNVWVDDSAEQDRAVVNAFIEAESRDDDEDTTEERREVAIARAIWEALDAEGLIDVNLSRFAARIRYGSVRNRRNPRMFHDMIKSVALLKSRQRERRTLPNGTVRIYATREDFDAACLVFTALHGTAGGQETKLTRRESDLIDVISKAKLERFDLVTLQELTKLSASTIEKTIKGYKSRDTKYSGLLDKVPFISPMEVSESESRKEYDPDSDARNEKDQVKTITRGRRATVWTFDRGTFESWRKGLAVWLAPETDGNGPDSESRNNAAFAEKRGISAENSAKNNTLTTGESDGSEREREREEEREVIFAEKKRCREPLAEACVSADDRPEEHTHAAVSISAPTIFRENSAKNSNSAPIAERSPDDAPFTRGNFRENYPDFRENSKIPRKMIDPADYAPIVDKVAVEPCQGCGGRLVHYQERYQAVKARGKGATAIRICRGCYEAAKRREVAAVQVLNTVPIEELRKVDDPDRFGRCDVCNVERVAYHDPGSRLAICSACFAKLAREQVDIR